MRLSLIHILFINDKMKQLQGSESHKGKHPKYRSTFEKEHPEAAGNSGEETKESTDCLAEAGTQDSQTAVARKQIKELDSKLKEAVRQGSGKQHPFPRGQSRKRRQGEKLCADAGYRDRTRSFCASFCKRTAESI